MFDTPINNDTYATSDGAIRLVCQDAADFLATLADKSVDLVVTSPPFNMLPRDTKSYGYRARRLRDNWLLKIREVGYSDNMPEWAYREWLRKMVGECLRVSRGVVCLHHKCRGQDDYLSHPLQFLADFPLWGEIIWVHGTPAQNQQRHPVSHEAIYVFGRGGKKWWNQECARYQSVWFVSPERGFDGHPCPFPLEIPKRLVDSFTTKRGQLVVDPFAGRGTTLAAAAQLGRKAIGCEISPAFFEVAKRYLSEPPVLGAETQLGFLEGEEAATVGFDIGTTAGPLTLQAGWGEGASLPLPLGEGRGEGGSRAFDVPADNPSAFPHPNPLPAGEGIPSKPSPWAANDVPLLTRSTASKKPVSGRESVA